MVFIEVYKSSFTGNTLYSPPTDLKKLEVTLKDTLGSIYLKTIDIIKFRWMIEKNGIYWFHGLRRLQPVPYIYIVPELYFLKGLQKPPFVPKYEQLPVRRMVETPMLKVAGTLF